MTVGPISSRYGLFDCYTNYYTEPHCLTAAGKGATSVGVQIVHRLDTNEDGFWLFATAVGLLGSFRSRVGRAAARGRCLRLTSRRGEAPMRSEGNRASWC